MSKELRSITTVDLGPGQGVARIEKIGYVSGPWVVLTILTPCTVFDNGNVRPASSTEVGLSADVIGRLMEAMS